MEPNAEVPPSQHPPESGPNYIDPFLRGCGATCGLLIFGMALPAVLFCGALKLWYEWIRARHNGIEADKIARTRKWALWLTIISVPLSLFVMGTNTSACSIAACGREIPFGFITATLDGFALVVFGIGLLWLKIRE